MKEEEIITLIKVFLKNNVRIEVPPRMTTNTFHIKALQTIDRGILQDISSTCKEMKYDYTLKVIELGGLSFYFFPEEKEIKKRG